MDFAYTARTIAGDSKAGQVAAESLEAARGQLRSQGLFVVTLDASGQRTASTASVAKHSGPRRLRHRERVQFTAQMAVMVDAGVPVAAALDSLSVEAKGSRLAAVAKALQDDVEAGESLSQAMQKQPGSFNETYRNLVRASEATGTLGTVLSRLAAQLDQEREVFQQVKSALTYPACMILGAIGVAIFLLTFVFPQILPLFAGRDLELPLPTRIMMTASDLLVNHSGKVLGGLLMVVSGLVMIWRTPSGRRVFDRLLLRMPIFGPLLTKLAIARTLRTLASTTHAGVPILEALELTASVARNGEYVALWNNAAESISSGQSLQRSLEGTTLMPPSLLRMIGAGEQTGRLPDVLLKISDGLEGDLKHAIKAATGALEPAMVFVMGGMIGTIALGILLPVFKLSTSGLG